MVLYLIRRIRRDYILGQGEWVEILTNKYKERTVERVKTFQV